MQPVNLSHFFSTFIPFHFIPFVIIITFLILVNLHRLWRRWSSRYRRDGLCHGTDSLGINPARVCEKSGCELGRQTLPCPELRGTRLLLGRRGRREAGTRKQDLVRAAKVGRPVVGHRDR